LIGRRNNGNHTPLQALHMSYANRSRRNKRRYKMPAMLLGRSLNRDIGRAKMIARHRRGSPICSLVMGDPLDLASERHLLVLIPAQGLIEVLWFEVRPQRIKKVKVGVDGLHREEAAEPPASAPPDNQVDS